jgi:hypothetical protein
MEHFKLDNDNAPDVEFDGELIGSGSSKGDNPYNSATRWEVFKIYRTKAGTLVGQAIGRTQWEGERDRFNTRVCDSEQSLIDFFGLTDPAKEALDEAGIKTSITVE